MTSSERPKERGHQSVNILGERGDQASVRPAVARVDRIALTPRVTSSVEWLLLHPIETAADEEESLKIVESHRHLNMLAVDVALEREFRRRRPMVGERRSPRAVGRLFEHERAFQ